VKQTTGRADDCSIFNVKVNENNQQLGTSFFFTSENHVSSLFVTGRHLLCSEVAGNVF
jgi:hypothetical protein